LPSPFFLSQLVLQLQHPVAPPQEPKTKKKYHYKTQQQQQTVFLSVCLSVYYTKSTRVSELLVGFLLLLLLLQRVMII
jgi:hypothetical protein